MQSPIEFSCCCNKSNCIRLQEFEEAFKRTENDALLAAAGIYNR